MSGDSAEAIFGCVGAYLPVEVNEKLLLDIFL